MIADIKFKSSDLNSLEPVFLRLLKKHKISNRNEEVLRILKQAIFAEIDDSEMINLLENNAGLDFLKASDLAFDLILEILDKKKEVEQIKEKLQTQGKIDFSPDKIVAEFLTVLPRLSGDPNLKKRFTEAIISWLKDIRDISELKEALMRSTKVGGCGLTVDEFNSLYELLSAKKQEIADKKIDMGQIIEAYENKHSLDVLNESDLPETEIDVSIKASKPLPAKEKLTGEDLTIDKILESRGIDYNALARKEAIKRDLDLQEKSKEQKQTGSLAAEIEKKEAFLEEKEVLAPPAPAVVSQQEQTKPLKADLFEKVEVKTPVKPAFNQRNTWKPPVFNQPDKPVSQNAVSAPKTIEPQAQSVETISRFNEQPAIKKPSLSKPQSGFRPMVDDVKFATKVYGPIEELKSLEINDFRRLSRDPNEAANKIMAKLDLLEDDSLSKRAEGIQALKQSPLYKLYANIMNQAMMQGQPFEKILEVDKKISLAEFRTIMELNKNLKY